MDFPLNRGTVVMIGTMSMRLKSDTVVEIAADNMDQVAEMFAASAGPRAFGEHLAKMKHNEVKTIQEFGETLEVDVEVTYGAHGARQENVLGDPRWPASRRSAPARAEAPPVEERFVPTPEGVAPGRYPPEIQTATDPPLADPAPVPAVFVTPSIEPVDPAVATEPMPLGDPEPESDDLPADFPGLEALSRKGITTWSEVADYSEEDLQQIKDIGPATSEKIIEAVEVHRAGKDAQ
jgi:hypothetical protein